MPLNQPPLAVPRRSADAAKTNPFGARRVMGYLFGMTPVEAALSFLGAVLCTFLVENLFATKSWWAMAGLAFTFFTLAHIYFTSTRFIVLPEFIVLIACVNWVVAPWLAYFYVPSFYLFRMVIPMNDYLSYTVPCVMALWLGLHVPLRYRGSESRTIAVPKISKQIYTAIDILIGFALFLSMFAHSLPRVLAFLYYILANLRFVCVFILMLLSARGWWIRALVVYMSLFSASASGGVFYEFILWMGYMTICVAYTHRWKFRLLISFVIVFWAVTTLNTIKFEYRRLIWEKTYSQTQKLALLAQMAWGHVTNDPAWKVETPFGDKLVRWNQGWIIARVMATVPKIEPYAKGSTIWSAINASLLPRIFSPKKMTAASQEMFTRYTNIPLTETTSMALGTAGEFYANFGKTGGIIAVGLYGFVIGLAFSHFARVSRKNALWWAWVPFVMLAALVCEWNLVDILNHLLKSYLVMVASLKLIPVFRYYLFRSEIRRAGPA